MNLQVLVEKVDDGWYGQVIAGKTRPVFCLFFDGNEWSSQRSVINRMTRYLQALEEPDSSKQVEHDYTLMVNP